MGLRIAKSSGAILCGVFLLLCVQGCVRARHLTDNTMSYYEPLSAGDEVSESPDMMSSDPSDTVPNIDGFVDKSSVVDPLAEEVYYVPTGEYIVPAPAPAPGFLAPVLAPVLETAPEFESTLSCRNIKEC